MPKNTCWVESDAYDRRLFGQLRAESPSLRELEDAGTTLLPHFGSLLQDLFCALFKYNVRFADRSSVLPSALLNQKFLNAIIQGPQYDYLRELTLLNEARAGLSTLILGERLLSLVKEEKVLTRVKRFGKQSVEVVLFCFGKQIASMPRQRDKLVNQRCALLVI